MDCVAARHARNLKRVGGGLLRPLRHLRLGSHADLDETVVSRVGQLADHLKGSFGRAEGRELDPIDLGLKRLPELTPSPLGLIRLAWRSPRSEALPTQLARSRARVPQGSALGVGVQLHAAV